MQANYKVLSTFALAMLITGSIDSIRNLPATALFGPTLIFFFVVSAILFLIPTGLISAELAATKNLQGGIYGWVKAAFGERMGVLAIWLQWINTMVWYPTILSFIAGTAAFLINPNLANNKTYLVAVILCVFWLLTWINLKGINISGKVASFCAIVGMIIPMALIVLLGIVWLATGRPLAIHLTVHTMIPHLGRGDSWISLTAIMAAFLGMELATVHVKSVKDPRKSFSTALSFAIIFILITMILGSLAIAFILPESKINLVDGVMQAFSNFLNLYHLHWMTDVLAVMLLIGSVGGMINWLISPAKGLFHAGENGYLPAFLTKVNRYGVAGNVLIAQAVLVTLICLAFLLMPSVNGSYWLLTDLSTELYMLMYVLMCVAAICLKTRIKAYASIELMPLGRLGVWIISLLGLIGCLVTFMVGFFPPSGIDVGGFIHYEIVFSSGIVIMILPVFALFLYKKKRASKN